MHVRVTASQSDGGIPPEMNTQRWSCASISAADPGVHEERLFGESLWSRSAAPEVFIHCARVGLAPRPPQHSLEPLPLTLSIQAMEMPKTGFSDAREALIGVVELEEAGLNFGIEVQ